MRIAIVTAVWRRPEIFAMFAMGVKALQEYFAPQVEIICCVAGSEGHASRTMVGNWANFYYTETPNAPLSAKMNSAAHLARKFSPNACVMVGSDDIIGVNLMAKYIEHAQRGIDYSYLTDCYFFDVRSKRGLYWAGYTKSFNKGKGAGIGRLISARALNAISWNCWPPGYDRVLDTAFDKQMDKIQCAKMDINLKRDKLFALDIKSSINMTPFDKWDNSFFIDGRQLLYDNLPKPLADCIYGK
jgi:hypothetical protein